MACNASKGAAKHDYSHRVAEVKKHLVLFAMRILSRIQQRAFLEYWYRIRESASGNHKNVYNYIGLVNYYLLQSVNNF